MVEVLPKVDFLQGNGVVQGINLHLCLRPLALPHCLFSKCLRGFSLSHTDVSVTTEVEDLTTSIDLQDVYSKVKCKVGSLNVHHGVKR